MELPDKLTQGSFDRWSILLRRRAVERLKKWQPQNDFEEPRTWPSPEKRQPPRADISSKSANRRSLSGDRQMKMLRYRHVPIILLLAGLAGCNQQQSTQELKEKTAQATAEVKHDAEAMAAGIRERWSRDKPLDLNTATKEQLLSLPGVTGPEANRVIAGRPYAAPGDVVTRRIMPKTEYDKIADRVTAKN